MSLLFHVFLHLMVHPLRGQSTWLLGHYQGQWVVIIGPSNCSIWTTIKAVRTINKLTYAWHKWYLINQSRGISMELRWLFRWMESHDFMADMMTSTVYWCIASKLKAARNLYWMSNMFLWAEIFLFFVCYHVFPKRHSQLDYELNDL